MYLAILGRSFFLSFLFSFSSSSPPSFFSVFLFHFCHLVTASPCVQNPRQTGFISDRVSFPRLPYTGVLSAHPLAFVPAPFVSFHLKYILKLEPGKASAFAIGTQLEGL